MKYSILPILITILTTSCTNERKIYFKNIEGEWQIEKFYHKEKDLTLERFYILGFQDVKNAWMIKRDNGKSEFIKFDYKFYKDVDTLKVNITNAEDIRLNANYNVYIDTIGESEEDYLIKLTLDNEKTYIETIRQKLKYYYPPGVKSDNPRSKANK